MDDGNDVDVTAELGGIGGLLVGLPGEMLSLPYAVAPGDRCQRLADIVDRYGVGQALSGVLRGSIDMVSGAKLCLPTDETDFKLRGRLPLEWSRVYSSALSASTLLGRGWRTRWEVTLRKAGERLLYTGERGQILSVPFPRMGSQVIAASAQLHVAHLADGRFVVADLAPLYRVFGDFDVDGVARLKYLEDISGQRIGCLWDAAGRLLRMRGTCGHELKMHYDADARLSGIECVDGGPVGMLVRYAYGRDGELVEVRNRIGDTMRRFAWRDAHLVEEAGPLGMSTRYGWQTIDGVARVVERVTSAGERDRFVYDLENGRSQATDVFGDTAIWQHDGHGQVVAHTGFDGRRYRFDYDEAGSLHTLTLPGERVVTLAYDALGRVVEERNPQGQVRTTHYAFATLDPVAVVMSDGRRQMWRRNGRLQPLHYQASSGEITHFEYDADGLTVRSIDALGGVRSFEHDAWGQPTRHTAADGGVTHYERDVNGYVVRYTDASGATTQIERDELGRPLTVTRPDGHHERHIWNAAGQRISFVGATGQSRHWNRDRRGNVVRFVDEEGHACVFEYDAHGRVLRIESANGALQRLSWNAAGCVSIADADGVTRRFDYTDAGQISRLTMQAGSLIRHESFAYDAVGRVIHRDTLHNRYVFRYSARGLLEAVLRTPTDEGELLGIGEDEIRFEYDSADRLLAERGANGELRFTRNASGRLVATTLPQGREVRTRRYSNGDIATVEFDEREIARFWYDSMRRVVACKQVALTTHISYSILGWPVWWRPVSSDDPASAAQPSDSDLGLWREVTYDASGAVVSINYPQEGRAHYDYDRRGCLLRHVPREAGIEYFSWDAAGNLLDTPVGNWLPTIYPDHRLRECRGYQYEYDAWGQLVQRRGRGHPVRFEWDAEGHVVAAHMKGYTVRYRYDAMGRRMAKVVERSIANRQQNGEQDEVTHYLWQGDRLLQERRAGWLRTYLYRPCSGELARHAPLACVDQHLSSFGDVCKTQVFQYHTDMAGTAVALTDSTGKAIWQGRYQAWGHAPTRDWAQRSDVFQPLRLAGQYLDVETGLHYNGTRIYDPDAGRYISPDRTGRGGVSPYCYAATPLTWSNPTGRATPLPVGIARRTAEHSYSDLLPDPARHLTGIVEQFDDVPGWDTFETGFEDNVKI